VRLGIFNQRYRASRNATACRRWHRLANERNHYLGGVGDELIGRAKSGTPPA